MGRRWRPTALSEAAERETAAQGGAARFVADMLRGGGAHFAASLAEP